MALPSLVNGILSLARRKNRRLEQDSDSSLNYYTDQSVAIKKELRRLRFERGMNRLRAASPLVLLGAGVGLLAARKYKLSSYFVSGFIVQKVLEGFVLPPARSAKDIDFEEYAMKLERGDFGKLEVIPFK